MKIHEFQAKQVFANAGVPVLTNVVARTAEEASAAYEHLGGEIAVVKAQIHAGGRGKGTIREVPEQHGVQLVRSADEARQVAENILGNTLVTIQTGEEGQRGPAGAGGRRLSISPVNSTWEWSWIAMLGNRF